MAAKVQTIGNPRNSPTVKMEVGQPEGEVPLKLVKVQLASETTLFLRKHRFGRTSEQKRLLNNHNIDNSAIGI